MSEQTGDTASDGRCPKCCGALHDCPKVPKYEDGLLCYDCCAVYLPSSARLAELEQQVARLSSSLMRCAAATVDTSKYASEERAAHALGEAMDHKPVEEIDELVNDRFSDLECEVARLTDDNSHLHAMLLLSYQDFSPLIPWTTESIAAELERRRKNDATKTATGESNA